MQVPWELVEELTQRHDLGRFCSGRESVDTWFRLKAWSNRHTVATHVCVGGGVVVGFFAWRTIVVDTTDMPRWARSAGDDGGFAPALLLAQMGLHETLQGNGHGTALFWRAVEAGLQVDAAVRVPLMVVDAADERLVDFYSSRGMKRIGTSLRLALPTRRLRSSMADRSAGLQRGVR